MIENSSDKEKEIGKLLYDLCVLSQKYGVDAEKALYDKCNEKIETVKEEEDK
ncbi:MAG: hypothetical protein MJ072_02660 [Clostridia bacterium]|nr:hypothetical protein [Clostridia bacterium]